MFFLVKTYNPRQTQVRRNRPFEEIELDIKKKRKTSVALGKNIRLKNVFLYPLIGVAVIAILFMANNYQKNMPVQDIRVDIHANENNQFLNDIAIKKIITNEGETSIIGAPMNSVQLEGLEFSLLSHPTVEEAEVYKTIQGVLNVEVALRKPVARLINNSGNYIYMDANGNKFPSTNLASANVVLVRGDFDEALVDTFGCSTIESALPVLNFIHNDPFWNAQISEVIIDQSGAITLSPQIGSLEIEFGQPVRIEDKFQNLRDFYRQVLREVGWNKYRKISLKYKGQIVAK